MGPVIRLMGLLWGAVLVFKFMARRREPIAAGLRSGWCCRAKSALHLFPLHLGSQVLTSFSHLRNLVDMFWVLGLDRDRLWLTKQGPLGKGPYDPMCVAGVQHTYIPPDAAHPAQVLGNPKPFLKHGLRSA